MTFRQLRNGRFSPNLATLATTRKSWLKRRFWREIYEKFPFRGYLHPKSHTWMGSNMYLTHSRLQVKGCTAQIYCLLHIGFRSTFLYDVRLWRYRVSKLPNFQILAYFPHTKLLKHTFWWPAYSPGVTSQNDYGVFLRLLVGELGTPNLPKFSPMANGYTHTEYTARQICTKYVWKRAILRTDVLSHQIFSPQPLKSTQNPIFGDLSMQTYYTESSP